MSWLVRMCAETEKQKEKEKGCGGRSMDVNRYAIPIPILSFTSQNHLQLKRDCSDIITGKNVCTRQGRYTDLSGAFRVR